MKACQGGIGDARFTGAGDGALQNPIKLGSGLIVYSQKMTLAAMQMADMKVWAHRS